MKHSIQYFKPCAVLLLLVHAYPNLVAAASTQVVANFESTRFLDGTNLTDNAPTVAVTVDWSSDQGYFAGLDCFVSSVDIDTGIDKGCDTYGGYFKVLNENNALSAKLTHHSYSDGFDQEWDFTDISGSWHINNKSKLSAVYSNNWLNRPFDTVALKGQTQLAISDNLNLNLSGSVLAIESGAPVTTLIYARATLSYTQNRWTAQAGLAHIDPDQIRMVPFNADTAQLFFTLGYRLH